MLYLVKLYFRNLRDVKIFPGKQKLKKFITTRPDLQEILKGVIHVEKKGH